MIQYLVVELKRLREEDRNGMEEDLSAESFIRLNNDVVTSGSIISSTDFHFDMSNYVGNNIADDEDDPDHEID